LSYRPCPCLRWGNCDGTDRHRERSGEITVRPYDFSLADIIPCRVQVIWLIKGECEFTTEHAPGSRRVLPHAAFTAASELYAEVEYRLGRTGAPGRTLQWTVRVNGVQRYQDLAPELREVVDYVAGRKRKQMPFGRWLAQRERRRRGGA
jgi:hypothetical protein